MKGCICSTPIYSYRGWTFEFHRYLGPHPLRKDGEPRKRVGAKFWDMFHEFLSLPEAEQETYSVCGGCERYEVTS